MYMRGSWHVSADDCGVGVVGADGDVNNVASGLSAMSECWNLKKNAFTQNFFGFLFLARELRCDPLQSETLRFVL